MAVSAHHEQIGTQINAHVESVSGGIEIADVLLSRAADRSGGIQGRNYYDSRTVNDLERFDPETREQIIEEQLVGPVDLTEIPMSIVIVEEIADVIPGIAVEPRAEPAKRPRAFRTALPPTNSPCTRV